MNAKDLSQRTPLYYALQYGFNNIANVKIL